METLNYIFEYILGPPIIGIIGLFQLFDEQFPLSTILISFFFVACCYRFIISRFISGDPLSPMEALSDNVKAHGRFHQKAVNDWQRQKKRDEARAARAARRYRKSYSSNSHSSSD